MPLNSILLEGQLASAPVLSTADDGSSFCRFSLSSSTDALDVPIVAKGRLALRCSELLGLSSFVRIVGRIARDSSIPTSPGFFPLAIYVEHVEVMPSRSSHHAEVA